MPRLLSLAVLIGALWAGDVYFFHGFYRDAIWSEMNRGAKIINGVAQSVIDKLNR